MTSRYGLSRAVVTDQLCAVYWQRNFRNWARQPVVTKLDSVWFKLFTQPTTDTACLVDRDEHSLFAGLFHGIPF